MRRPLAGVRNSPLGRSIQLDRLSNSHRFSLLDRLSMPSQIGPTTSRAPQWIGNERSHLRSLSAKLRSQKRSLECGKSTRKKNPGKRAHKGG
jgi:hypothetical protein